MMFAYFNPTKSISLSSCLTLLRYDSMIFVCVFVLSKILMVLTTIACSMISLFRDVLFSYH